MTLALSNQYGHKNCVTYFHFEQLSIVATLIWEETKKKGVLEKKAIEEKQIILLESMQRLR